MAWAATTVIILVPTAVEALRGLWRKEAGVDFIALLAMAGTLVLQEFLAGAIIAVMLTGGSALERFAVARARRELSALLSRAPRSAHRRVGDDVFDVDVDAVVPGDVLIVKPGEVVPVDGMLLDATAVLDESALTGEARPLSIMRGTNLRSGTTNAGGPFTLRATAAAAGSTYAGILRLVDSAEESKAPFVRLADRYALGFLAATVVLATIAWLVSGDPVRALAVLVVATPCPLILAAPAALIAGVSRAARHGIIVKGGGPLEALGKAVVLLLDKTGTVTAGRPQVLTVEPLSDMSVDELVELAASLEQMSMHPFAPAITAEAQHRGRELSFPTDVHEEMGTGIRGRIHGRTVAVGQLAWVAPNARSTPVLRALESRTAVEGSSSVYVAIDGELAGALLLHDPIRAEAPRALRELRTLGIERIHMVTGDHPDVAELVGDALGIDHVFAERAPDEKVDVVRRVRREGLTAMVGDGINDAPALALADIGIAMGARGATAASEAADVVLTGDRLEGLVWARRIAHRTRRIALESVFVGMGLSIVAMVAAAAGLIPPVAGALLQEGIDVLVILNALRALGGPRMTPRRPAGTHGMAHELAHAHQALRPRVGELATLAARLEAIPALDAKAELERIRAVLNDELLPHEREEQRVAFPLIGRLLQPEDPTGPLIQTHHEIQRLSRLYGRLVARLPAGGPSRDDLRDLRRALYGLHAILTLHYAQEDEIYSILDSGDS